MDKYEVVHITLPFGKYTVKEVKKPYRYVFPQIYIFKKDANTKETVNGSAISVESVI